MSSPFASGPNPYAAPYMPPTPTPVVPAGPPQTTMDYMRSYNFIFENPAWMTTVLWLGLMTVAMAIIQGIGIILQLPVMGYQFEVIDALLKSSGRQYPTFDVNRFGDYFIRGLWPFLVNLVAGIVLGVLLLIVGGGGALVVVGVASAAGDEIGPVVGFVLGAFVLVAFIVALFVAMFYMIAMILRSGLSQDFVSAFQFDWIHDFVRRMWVEMLLAGLFWVITAVALELLGLLALCIGLFFVIPLILLAYSHLLYQLYVVYLSRGGIPVTTKAALPSFMPTPPPPSSLPQKY